MNLYQKLGASSLTLLVFAVLLSIRVLTGQRSKKEIYFIAGTVLAIMVLVTIFCFIIYSKYKV